MLPKPIRRSPGQWQGIVWRHALLVFEPKTLRHPRHMLLFVTGGRTGRQPSDGDLATGLHLAQLSGGRVAMLFQVPNQPLFDDRVEDDLITETWLRYLETGDESWPLLFPMVKSAVKAIDALEQFARQQWDGTLDGVVISGASKRGWTSWLVPVVDPRVIATAPIVINVLNFKPQMQHQLDSWGKYSEQIDDYTRKGLVKTGEETPREQQLRQMMDPFTYRSRLSLPKLMINGTNDRYWVVDASKFYWNELVGPKYVLQVPNAGHSLEGGRELALTTLGVFFRHAATATPLPDIHWKVMESETGTELMLESKSRPVATRHWVAHSTTRDFRESKWEPRPLKENGSGFVGRIDQPAEGHFAHYGESQFEFEGLPFSLCTLIHTR
jgi:PhoPQ-activated pathogenicity-related protein